MSGSARFPPLPCPAMPDAPTCPAPGLPPRSDRLLNQRRAP